MKFALLIVITMLISACSSAPIQKLSPEEEEALRESRVERHIMHDIHMRGLE